MAENKHTEASRADHLILEIASSWPSADSPVKPEMIASAHAAVTECPASPKLRCMLADLLVADAKSATFRDIEEAMKHLNKALDIDARCFEALEGLGYIHDVFYDDFGASVDCFRRAMAIFEGVDTVCGLARALAQNGLVEEALRLLRNTLHRESPNVIKLRTEIEADEWSPS